MRSALRRVGLPRSGALAELLVDDAISTDPDLYMAFSHAVAAWDVSTVLPRLNVATLLIWGQRDELVPPRIGARYLQLLPHAKLVIVPGSGHSPPIERPRQFAAMLRAFSTPLMRAA